MSYGFVVDIEDGEPVKKAELGNLSDYNYAYEPILGKTIGDYLGGEKLSDTNSTLTDLVNKLGTEPSAKEYVQTLLNLTNKYPNAVWMIYG